MLLDRAGMHVKTCTQRHATIAGSNLDIDARPIFGGGRNENMFFRTVRVDLSKKVPMRALRLGFLPHMQRPGEIEKTVPRPSP
jgi:hypothetical protein